MNRISKRLAIVGLLLAVSCTDSSIKILGSTYTLQGIVADAVTGARIGGDLKMFLVQGPEVRGPSRLITGTTDPLLGEYAFTGIPVEYVGGNNVWKVVVVKSGYQRFESEVSFVASAVATAAAANNALLDQAFSRIGNVYLFPIGVTAPDYAFIATYNGKPVPGATVQLDPISASNGGLVVTGGAGDTLIANNGYVASLAATTDANGKATFAGTLLALGARYNVQVLPVAFKEPTTGTTVQLGLFNSVDSFIDAGLSKVLQNIALNPLNVRTSAEPIYLVDASNRIGRQIQADGKLTITFNAPVTVVNPNGFTALYNPGIKADGTTPGTSQLNSLQNVNALLSGDGLTLTLAPNFSATPTGSTGTPQAPAATDRAVVIQYREGTALVVPRDYPAQTFSVVAPGTAAPLKFLDGTTDSGVVIISGP